jgi:hypothetical protein
MPSEWHCSCGREQHLMLPAAADEPIRHCVACGCEQLYRQKNFPQWLGLSLLAIACSAFFVLQGLYLPRPAWVILLGSAAFDMILYLFVGDVIVCYRCHARHYGLAKQKSYDPFELPIAEKYRQERIRRELAGKS